MDQSKKAILAVVLIVIAAGLFFWHFPSNNSRNLEEPPELVMNTPEVKALENIFTRKGSKKWTDPSLWTSPKAASTYAPLAEKLLTATPSMNDVKILGYGTNKENNDALFIVIEVPTTEKAVKVEFHPGKGQQMLMDLIVEGQITAKEYKKR